MGRMLFRRVAVLLSWVVAPVLLPVSSGFSAQTTSKPAANTMVTEPGDPQAYYDAGRREWFVRPGVLAEPEGGGKGSAFSLSLLESTTILAVNGPRPEVLGPWGSPIMDSLEKSLGSVKLNQPLMVAVTLSPKDEPSFAVWSPEKLNDRVRQEITRILAAQTQAPRPLYVDCHFAFVYHPPGMKEQDDPGIPASFYPSWRESREYQTASLAEKVRLLRKWSRVQALPLLAGTAAQVEAKFEGVRAFGGAVLKLEVNKTMDVEQLTFRDPNFWRATMEMAGGNVTVAATQAFLFAAKGELGKTGRLLQFLPRAVDGQQLASLLLARLRGRLEDIEARTGRRIAEGIRLYDQRQYEKAAAVFENVLKENPASAWACHELLLTRRTMTRSDEVVEDYEAKVYSLDPLYPSAPILVGTGERLYRALLRMGMKELFRDQTKGKSDYAKYTQTVFDLGEYGYAGLLYWDTFTRVTPGDSEALRYFLYCLERLGVRQMKTFFKPECSTGFDRIEQDRRKRMEEHPAYQVMQKKQ
jgi:tetratricopeptide (TPR) repeat protein